MELEEQEVQVDSEDERWGAGSPWYQRAYFEKRVEQELYRSRRYETETTVLVVHIPAISRGAARSLRDFVSSQLRLIDTAGLLGNGDYGICLPHTPKDGGEVVAGRIRDFMHEYEPSVGVASFGSDGTEFDELFSVAEARAA